MKEIAEVAERSWLDSWPGNMQEEAVGQMETAEAYQMMTEMCKLRKWRR